MPRSEGRTIVPCFSPFLGSGLDRLDCLKRFPGEVEVSLGWLGELSTEEAPDDIRVVGVHIHECLLDDGPVRGRYG